MRIPSIRIAFGLLAFGILPAIATHAATVPNPVNGSYPQNSTPTVTAWGVDDNNTSTLVPYPAQFYTFCPWVALAQQGSDFAPWTFTFAGNGNAIPNIPQADLTVNIYSAWAAINDPVTDLSGTQRARPMNNNATRADAGGADWELTYVPNATGANPLDPTNISFLQVARFRTCDSTDDLTCTWSNYTYVFDNGGDTTTPFYVQSGGIGGNGITNGVGGSTVTNANAQWMFDIPYLTCENSGTPQSAGIGIGASANCRGGTDGSVLASDVQFQVFVATRAANAVTLYGGLQWGYLYTNTDAPEPSSLALAGAGMAFLAIQIVRTRASRRQRSVS